MMATYRPTFVSHAHADNDLCDRYVNALRARGADVWYDRTNAQVGHMLGAQLRHELVQRSAFVLLLTQPALDSFWVTLETQSYLQLMAQDPARILVPVRIGPCDVPAILNAFLWVDALHMPFEQAVDAIASALTITTVGTRPAAPMPDVTPPTPAAPRDALPPLGPAPAPRDSTSALHLTPTSLYNLGFRGYTVRGVDVVLPPLCPVPNGVFIMGSDTSKDPQADDNETPQYLVEVGPFALGQHPITVAEYACAVRTSAVRMPSELAGVSWQKQLARIDHPVVCVSWQDAVAYLRWLAGVTDQPWRLPTEAEWEEAARGADGRIYPWGDTFDKNRCNTSGSGIWTTTPVGRYPNSASPYGAQDMAGNVSEWTSSLFEPYPYNKADGREDQKSTATRVLRGGSWYDVSWGARAAFRDGSGPDYCNNDWGFRPAWAADL
ncbi:MAG: GldJ [Ktedonobacterales bacterium]|jgi:formylglycine-generating enzyme required for sulfatase activity|nr:MAG: GldJ [Ktedonobacterales bacterium]